MGSKSLKIGAWGQMAPETHLESEKARPSKFFGSILGAKTEPKSKKSRQNSASFLTSVSEAVFSRLGAILEPFGGGF